MPLSSVVFQQKNAFFISKARPRKVLSRSPFSLFDEGLSRELGPHYQTVDVRIGNQRMILDIAQGRWIPGNLKIIEDTRYSFSFSCHKKRTILR